MSNQLQTNLDAILDEKTTKILPGNVRKDVQIFDVVGSYEGTLSRVQSNLVIADYANQNTITGSNYKEYWKATDFTTWFCLPYDIGTQKYVCGISNMGDGLYKRWLIVLNRSLTTVDFSRTSDDYAGMYMSSNYIVKCFKFNDITDISLLQDGYGKDELGVECELTDLPYIPDTNGTYDMEDNMLILCPKTSGVGYVGQNYTNYYHTGYGDVEVWTDMLNVDAITKDVPAYNNLGQKYLGTLNTKQVFNVINQNGIVYQYLEDYKTQKADTPLCTLLPDKSILKKYYAFWEHTEDMGGRYMKECYLFTDDNPLNIAFYIPTNNTYTQLRIQATDTTKVYRFSYSEISELQDKWELFENRKNVCIYDQDDLDFSLLQFVQWDEVTDFTETWFELRSTPSEPDPNGLIYPYVRMITNNQILDTDGTILVESTIVESLDTSDATATADDMEYDATAYVNGEKITGSLYGAYR